MPGRKAAAENDDQRNDGISQNRQSNIQDRLNVQAQHATDNGA
jgi:hypothetical protein